MSYAEERGSMRFEKRANFVSCRSRQVLAKVHSGQIQQLTCHQEIGEVSRTT